MNSAAPTPRNHVLAAHMQSAMRRGLAATLAATARSRSVAPTSEARSAAASQSLQTGAVISVGLKRIPCFFPSSAECAKAAACASLKNDGALAPLTAGMRSCTLLSDEGSACAKMRHRGTADARLIHSKHERGCATRIPNERLQ